jgi:hypothetical protein
MDTDRRKNTGHWHLLNLPYVLYLANQGEWPQMTDTAISILANLDRFCRQFCDVPGFAGVLRPLKSGIWKDDDPEFWSVLAHAYLALRFDDNPELRVRAFAGRFPGGGTKNADFVLEVATKSADAYVDVVMKHRPKFMTSEDAREELRTHADRKLGTKYGAALDGALEAAVAVVCVAKTEQLDILARDPSILASVGGQELDRPAGSGACFFLFSAASRDRRWELRLFSAKEWESICASADPEPVSGT